MKYEDLLKEGVKIRKAWWEPSGEICVGQNGVKRLTVSMIPGQGAMVPWLKAEDKDGIISMHNCAQLSGLELEQLTLQE